MADRPAAPPPPGGLGRRSARGAADGPSDGELLERLAAGDTRVMELIYDRYCRPAFSLARRICADEGIAEDVVQEVFLTLWREPSRYDTTRGMFATWLLTLVHHKAVDAVRRESAVRRRTVPGSEDGEDWSVPPGPGADQAALGSVLAGQVRDALGRLPAEQRQALALAYYGGYTQREIAALVGVPLGTVKSRMFTGVQRLRALLGPLLAEMGPAELAGGAR